MRYLLRRRRLGRGSCRGITAQSREGLRVFRNDQLPDEAREAEVCFRWGCTSAIPGEPLIVNTAEAIHGVSVDKAAFRRRIGELAPPVWQQVEELVYPAVIRPITHHQGRHLHVVQGVEAALEAIQACEARAGGWYGAPLVNKTEEYRVCIAQGRVVWVARKYPGNPEQVAWNHYQGGRFENVRWDNWPLRVVRVACETFDLSGLDFGGVDIMVDQEGRAWVLEMNAAPSLTSEYRIQCMARVFDYICVNGKEAIPRVQERAGWEKFIHPAIFAEARLVS